MGADPRLRARDWPNLFIMRETFSSIKMIDDNKAQMTCFKYNMHGAFTYIHTTHAQYLHYHRGIITIA